MSKQNCWQYKKCGREPGGLKSQELGVCPAARDTSTQGVNEGEKGGRVCWAVTGTFCGGKVQGIFAQKHLSCMNCDFFKAVKTEQGSGNFVLVRTSIIK